jgi:4-hydroxyphenylpyruvate dioxygenase
VCSSLAPDAEAGIDRLAADIAELGERAAARGMRVGFEALAWGLHTWDYRDVWEIVRRANRANVGIVLDTFHIQASDLDLSVIRTIPADRIFLVQVADAPKLQMDYLSWSRHWRCMPGQGDFDLVGFMTALEATGYRGHLPLEIFNDRFRAGSSRAVALDGHCSLLSLLDEASRHLGRPVSDLPALPAPAIVDGVEFIEFAVRQTNRAAFEAARAAMGFSESGRHRTKAVSLWGQGAIRIVVNSHNEGFAQAYRSTHGTSVCAMALRVPDAQAAIARAAALLAVPHAGEVGPGELTIPAVRGPGGSLVCFVDGGSALGRWAEVDFTPGEVGDLGAGLVSVDHISQTIQHEEMLSWLLFCTSLFEARKTPSQAVLDPGGVVQSQVIESGLDQGHQGLRLVLNGSQSHPASCPPGSSLIVRFRRAAHRPEHGGYPAHGGKDDRERCRDAAHPRQ